MIGTSVTGSLYINNGETTYSTTRISIDPALGLATDNGNAAGTTVTIGPGIEFGYNDGANPDTADFTGSTLTVSDVDTFGAFLFEMVFTDASEYLPAAISLRTLQGDIVCAAGGAVTRSL